MSKVAIFRGQSRALLRIGLPLIGSHLAQLAISITDTAMLGWYDVRLLAGQVLGASLFFIVLMVGAGFGWAVMPMVAAAQDARRIRRVARMGLWVSGLFGLAAMGVFLFTAPLLTALGQEPDLARLAATYLGVAGWSILPALLVMVLKSYMAAREMTRAVLAITVLTALANGGLNYLLIFGSLGAPELGLTGAALASLVSTGFGFAVMVVWVLRTCPEHDLFRHFWRIDAEALNEVIRLGLPIGITNLSEVGLFAAATVMMGWLGEIPLAAHGIALQITSAVFMIHVGLSNAVTIRAGQAYGRGDAVALRQGAWTALALALAVAALTAVLFWSLPEMLVGLFLGPGELGREQVIAAGRGMLAAAALFQLVDASQILALSLLRGVHDTRVPMLLAAVSYWLVGVPASYGLGLGLELGGAGVWLGLAVGLALAAGLLMARFWGVSVRRIG